MKTIFKVNAKPMSISTRERIPSNPITNRKEFYESESTPRMTCSRKRQFDDKTGRAFTNDYYRSYWTRYPRSM